MVMGRVYQEERGVTYLLVMLAVVTWAWLRARGLLPMRASLQRVRTASVSSALSQSVRRITCWTSFFLAFLQIFSASMADLEIDHVISAFFPHNGDVYLYLPVFRKLIRGHAAFFVNSPRLFVFALFNLKFR